MDGHPHIFKDPLDCKVKVAKHPVHEIWLELAVMQVEQPEGQEVQAPLTAVKPSKQEVQIGLGLASGSSQSSQFFKLGGHLVQLLASIPIA